MVCSELIGLSGDSLIHCLYCRREELLTVFENKLIAISVDTVSLFRAI